MPSPLKAEHTQKSAPSESVQLNDSFSKELQPIVYTPEDCRKTSQNPPTVNLLKPLSNPMSFQAISSNTNSDDSLKMAYEAAIPVCGKKECRQEDLDSTFTKCEDTKILNSRLPEQQSVPNNNVLQRYGKRVFVHSFFSFFFFW